MGLRCRSFCALYASLFMCVAAALPVAALDPVLRLPDRARNALTASEFRVLAERLDFPAREEAVRAQIVAGNLPAFLRRLVPVTVVQIAGAQTNRIEFFVTPDYLAVGNDQDWMLMPMSPVTAQQVADQADCLLPTRRMVDLIHAAAGIKFKPEPIAPSPAMITVPVFADHDAGVKRQRAGYGGLALGTLVAGHKKDLVISPRLPQTAGKKEFIYGWHHPDGQPIQPLYAGHSITWVDYSHGARLVSRSVRVNGELNRLEKVLADPVLSRALSDEGPIAHPFYPTNFPANANVAAVESPAKFNEIASMHQLADGVRVVINSPVDGRSNSVSGCLLIYATPNGNTIEQTLGRLPKGTNEWRYDIQHVAAQTRFLRSQTADRRLVLACVGNDQQSWPAWRGRHGDQGIPRLIETLRNLAGTNLTLVLSGHSGGGSLIFGFLNAVNEVPASVSRLAFLDANYAYRRDLGHSDKLMRWLRGGVDRSLCVLAYDDASALLNGKTFVSADGGTWGRSHAMVNDLRESLGLVSRTNGLMESHRGLAGRAQFLLRQNPERKVWHTVLVERNGLIHAFQSGTPQEGRGYEYLGPRAYDRWISTE